MSPRRIKGAHIKSSQLQQWLMASPVNSRLLKPYVDRFLRIRNRWLLAMNRPVFRQPCERGGSGEGAERERRGSGYFAQLQQQWRGRRTPDAESLIVSTHDRSDVTNIRRSTAPSSDAPSPVGSHLEGRMTPTDGWKARSGDEHSLDGMSTRHKAGNQR